MNNSLEKTFRRYQVFVSSTFDDLKEERQNIITTILDLNAIPAGMEFFPAIDEEQMVHIQKVIDLSDYYVLIMGGRYGSLSADGRSFTEREYDYAVSKHIPVLAFIHKNIDQLPRFKTDSDEELFNKQKKFIEKVKNNKLVRFWSSSDELAKSFATSFHILTQTFPRPGWVRGDEPFDKKQEFRALLGKILGMPDFVIDSPGSIPLVLSVETVMELRIFVERGWITLEGCGGMTNLGAGNRIGNFIEERKNPHGMGSCYLLTIKPDYFN